MSWRIKQDPKISQIADTASTTTSAHGNAEPENELGGRERIGQCDTNVLHMHFLARARNEKIMSEKEGRIRDGRLRWKVERTSEG
jgi:hypothetical protein